MKYFVFRNTTVENLLGNSGFSYSGYNDISGADAGADTFIWFYLVPVKSKASEVVKEVTSWFNSIQLLSQHIPEGKKLLIFTLQNGYYPKYINNDFSVQHAVNSFHRDIIEFANQHSNVKIIQADEFFNGYTNEQIIDWKYYFISSMQINPRLAKPFRDWFYKQIDAIEFRRKKCLVLDLDNTLWGGILGEDGLEGIKIGGDYPGNAFSMFQQQLLELSKTGIILTVCSKNNEQDVLEVWEKNIFLSLKKEHFAAYRINWNNKADNIRELAEELNIGLDSIVFADDNPAERELVKQLLPMVEVPDFPDHPYQLPVFFREMQQKYFQVYSVTTEDTQKTEQYRANAQRAEEQQQFTNLADYLASLNIELTIQKANALNLPRIAQMTQKTNQFNLTTLRYSNEDIDALIKNNETVFCLSTKDKFGDNGITGAIILKAISHSIVEIDSLLLSCRILGKGIENAFVFSIMQLLKSNGVEKVLSRYITTAKNGQVKNFYESIGFEITSESNGVKAYEMQIQKEDFKIEPYYKIEMQ